MIIPYFIQNDSNFRPLLFNSLLIINSDLGNYIENRICIRNEIVLSKC